MGYYTRYSLEIEGEDTDNILELPGEESLRDRIMGELVDGDVKIYRMLEESCKWYGHEEDMKALSLKYPDVVFHLSGQGERAEACARQNLSADNSFIPRRASNYFS